MNLTDTVATILAILALTAGTGVFVAAEFSLTALDRSTVEANARGGTSRDRFIQRAHHRLSFQLSGAQLGISITTLATGYLTEPLVPSYRILGWSQSECLIGWPTVLSRFLPW